MTTTSATVPPVEAVAPGLVTRAPARAFSGARTLLLGLAAIGIGSSALGWASVGTREQFYYSWLVSFMFVLSLALGALFFVLVQHLTRAGWSVVVRRVVENAMAMPVLLLLFVPIAIGQGTIYSHWVHPDPADSVLAGKSSYLSVPFFFVRAAVFFAFWMGAAAWLRRTSMAQDRSGDPALTLRMARVAAPCMLLFALSLTFAAVDWIMSIDPHWYSTIFGVYYFAGTYMVFMAFLGLMLLWLRRKGLLAEAVTIEHYHDVGKLMFAFVVFWTYIAFAQYMLIWYANLPEETGWYQHHLAGKWELVGRFQMYGHFGIPFVFLMSRHIKRRRATLATAALFLLAIHWIDLHWLIMPNLHEEGPAPSWLDLSTLVGTLSLFLWAVLGRMQGAPLLPERDPRLAESLAFVNH